MEPTILHVEDAPHIAELVRVAFQSFGFRGTILSVGRVDEALAMIEEIKRRGDPLDLILVDMRLPDGSGLDVVRKVKTNPAWSTTPVLVLSSEADPRTVTEAYALGANCFVSKAPGGKSTIEAISALYQCWLEGALLPKAPRPDRAREALAHAVSIRSRVSECYTSLARKFTEEPKDMEFWLNLALNEGNLANLLAFFRNQLTEDDVPSETIDHITTLQARMEASLAAVESASERTPRPSREHGYRWALSLAANFEEEVFAEALGLLFPKAPVATRALRQRIAAHFIQLADWVSQQTADPELRRQAEDLHTRVERLKTLTSSACPDPGAWPQ